MPKGQTHRKVGNAPEQALHKKGIQIVNKLCLKNSSVSLAIRKKQSLCAIGVLGILTRSVHASPPCTHTHPRLGRTVLYLLISLWGLLGNGFPTRDPGLSFAGEAKKIIFKVLSVTDFAFLNKGRREEPGDGWWGAERDRGKDKIF